MKFFLVFLALSTTSAFAEQAAVNDPQYQPNAGTIFGDTSYSMIRAQVSNFSANGNLISQVLGYAPADNLSVFANVSHINFEQQEGLQDIGLNVKYRMLNSDHRWDLLGGVTVSPGDSETKSNGDSNGYTGGHGVYVGTEYGHRNSARTWSVFGNLNYNLAATEEDKSSTGDQKVEQDAHFDLALGAKLYTVLGENCGIKNTIGVNFTEEYDDDGSPKDTTEGSTYYSIGSEYQHVLSPSLYLRGGFIAALSGNNDGTTLMTYQVGAGYQF